MSELNGVGFDNDVLATKLPLEILLFDLGAKERAHLALSVIGQLNAPANVEMTAIRARSQDLHRGKLEGRTHTHNASNQRLATLDCPSGPILSRVRRIALFGLGQSGTLCMVPQRLIGKTNMSASAAAPRRRKELSGEVDISKTEEASAMGAQQKLLALNKAESLRLYPDVLQFLFAVRADWPRIIWRFLKI